MLAWIRSRGWDLQHFFGWSRPQLIAILKGKTMMTHRIWGFLDAIFN
jgi:hypothetical protein